MNSYVQVVGSGLICSIGTNYDECLNALRIGEHGIRPLDMLSSAHTGTLPVGQVTLGDEELVRLLGLENREVTRTAMLGLHAAREAVNNSGLKDITRWRTGLISGTTVGGMDRTERFMPEYLQDHTAGKLADVALHGCGAVTEFIAGELGVRDFVSTINTACSSSLNAIVYASRLINHDVLDVAIAGGTDALTKFTINGFNSLMILDKALCRPFDAERNGINLGEGAGYVVLLSDKVVREERLNPVAYVSGFANVSEAFHQTASSPDGRGAYASMEKAIEMAGLSGGEIGYINLHGTGTLNNDLAEGMALRRLFGATIPPHSSTKSFTGHALGGSGGIESVFCLMTLEHQCILPNLRFQSPMPEVQLTPATGFTAGKVDHAINNAFGFGGNCSSLILSRAR